MTTNNNNNNNNDDDDDDDGDGDNFLNLIHINLTVQYNVKPH